MKNRLLVLIAEKSSRDGKTPKISDINRATEVSRYTLKAMSNNTIKNYPSEAIDKLCVYFDCQLCDLLYIEN